MCCGGLIASVLGGMVFLFPVDCLLFADLVVVGV